MPGSIASVMKEAKEEGSFESLKTKGNKSKKCEGSPSQPCCIKGSIQVREEVIP